MPANLVYIDNDRRFRFINKASENWLQLSNSDVAGRHIKDVMGEPAYAAIRHHIDTVLSGQPVEFDMQIPFKQGVREMQAAYRPHLGTDGAILGYFVYATDKTREKITERALRESEDRFRTLLNSAPDAMLAVNADGKIIQSNQQAERMFGYASDDLLNQNVEILMPESFRKSRPGHRAMFRSEVRARTMGTGLELRGLRRGGSEFPVEISLSPVKIAGEDVVIASVRDMSWRKGLESALEAAKDHAEIANRAKSEFLANMSHELRTPLNAIIGFADLIMSETFGPIGIPKYKEYLHDIRDSGKHLLDLINDILDLSKIEARKMELSESHVDMHRLVRSCLAMIGERARACGVELVTEFPEGELPGLRADERVVKQVLINLTTNAVKFTPEGGKVTVKAWARPDSGCVMQIIDTGIGMAPEDIPRALTRFGQVDRHLSLDQSGSGLGLPLAKALVELHGGSIDLQSQPNAGTTVTVRFPAERILACEQASQLAS